MSTIHHQFTPDRSTRALLVVLTGLLAVIAVELWAFRPHAENTAHAQIPDTALQRRNIVEESRRTNQLLEQILEHLRTKPIKITIDHTDKSTSARATPVAPPSRR